MILAPALMVALGPGCVEDPALDRARYRAALRTGDCATVKDVALSDDCWITAASRRPAGAASQSARTGLCAHVVTDGDKGECAFAVAELLGTPELCRDAGPFADDCALHVVSAVFARQSTLDEGEARAQITLAGLAADDPRPWSAYFREVLGRKQPLAPSTCDSASPALKEGCRQTARALFDDRLNQARDRRQFTCTDGQPTPPWPFAWEPDPVLDAAFASRGDLCTPLDVPR